MLKIANTEELQGELQRLLRQAQGKRPSRARLAGEIDKVARRLVAVGHDSLLERKLDWAMDLAEIMKARFSKVGGWRDHHIDFTYHRDGAGGVCYLESRLGWDCTIRIDMVGSPEVEVRFTGNRKPVPQSGGLPDLDNLDLNEAMRTDAAQTFKIDEGAPMAQTMMAVSLWLSKHVPDPL